MQDSLPLAVEKPDGAALPRVVYHVAPNAEWHSLERSGGGISGVDGYVALTSGDSYVELANLLFGERLDVVLLFVDSKRLQAMRESTVQGVSVLLHPWPLPVSAVFEVAEMATDDNGRFLAHHETAALAAHGDDTFTDARERALGAVATWNRPWWIAGGWALDLHLGVLTRPHADLELSILRGDQAALYRHLEGWDLRAVAPGSRLVPWDGTPLDAPYHQIWARRGPGGGGTVADFVADPTMLDFLIEDHVGDRWCYRRDHRVTRDVGDIGATRDGLRFIRPEIALLYKAKQPRYKDERDAERVLPHLTSDARNWLRAALALAHPGQAPDR